jgi:excisionase family DNA binding protein
MPTDVVWLSTGEAAQRLGLGVPALRGLIETGKLEAYRFGRVVRITEHDLQTCVERCRIKPGELSEQQT